MSMKKNPFLHTGKLIYLGCFLAGFILFLILGKAFLDANALLNVNSLREIKDSTIDKWAFLKYVSWRRILVLAAGIFLWWKGFGKFFIYSMLGWHGLSMGACMYTCLLRYHFKGIFLWFFLYFPHLLFYAAALFCGMILSAERLAGKADRLKFLWQHSLIALALAASFFFGMYAECYINVALLQDFLQFF